MRAIPRPRVARAAQRRAARRGFALAALCASVVCGPGAAQSPTALSQVAASMRPGAWAELPTLGLTNELLTDSASYSYITQYSEDLAWDPVSRRLLFVGGPHTGQVKFITYGETANTWAAQPRPAFWDCPLNEPWGLCRGHSYDHLALDVAGRALYHRHYNSAVISRYDLATGAWSALPDIEQNPNSTCCGALEYFPELQRLVLVMGAFGEVSAWNPGTGAWSLLAQNLEMGSYTNFAEYNPVHKVMIFGGGWGSGNRNALHKLDRFGVVTRLSDHPFDQLGASQSIVTVDPLSGRYLVFGKIGGQERFYEYDVVTDTWTPQPAERRRPPFFALGPDGPIFGAVATPIATHGVVAFVKYAANNGSKVYLYKHQPGFGLTGDGAADDAPRGTMEHEPAVRDEPQGVAAPLAAPDVDFLNRCARRGVVRCYGFDDPVDLAPRMYDPSGGPGLCTGNRCWQVDTLNKASGAGSLRFEIPSHSGADTSGSFWINFADDLAVQFGGNASFFIQWRQRFSPEFLTTDYAGGGGWKQAIIGTGDQPGQPYYSCTALEVVTTNGYHRGFPQMYNSCTGSASHGPFDPFEQPFGSFDFKMQNARLAPYCLYSQGQSNPPAYFPPAGNCFGYAPAEWMTFQIQIQTGPRVGDEFVGSRVRMWIARQGQPSQLVFDWGPYNLTAGNPAQNQRFGKLWFLPYNTGKDPAQAHPVAYTWYDELIVARARIPDPAP